jgi:uncharacterized protein YraI
MSLRFSIVVFFSLIFLSTGCVSGVRGEMTPSITPLLLISTLPVTLTPALSDTPLPPPPAQPMAAHATPIEGVTSTQVNVRAEPSTASNVLGIIPPNTKVEITGKDPGENWWQINYPQEMDGKGWVTAQYITTATKPEVPIIGGAEIGNGNFAIIQQQINVRSGPGTDFNSLGTLNPQDVVGLMGKDANGVWLQINFASGPEGKGWVNAAFVQAQGVENLPIITETGLIVGTGTPTGIPFTPTPTVVPAWDDHDSPTSPIASVIFESTGTQLLIYNGDLSSPEGDSEDWIAFKSYSSFVFASLECKGSNSVGVEITKNSLPVGLNLVCGDQMKQFAIKAGSNYLMHLQALSTAGNIQYTNYILTIRTRP